MKLLKLKLTILAATLFSFNSYGNVKDNIDTTEKTQNDESGSHLVEKLMAADRIENGPDKRDGHQCEGGEGWGK